jgi:hypothetical protein
VLQRPLESAVGLGYRVLARWHEVYEGLNRREIQPFGYELKIPYPVLLLA